MSPWPTHVAIIGSRNDGDLRLLKVAVERILQCEPAIHDFDHLANSGAQTSSLPEAVFLVLPDGPWSTYDENTRTWQPTKIIEDAYRWVREHPNQPLYFARGERAGYENTPYRPSPLDTLTWMLSGITGIWEISPRLLEDAVESRPTGEWIRHMRLAKSQILVGSPARDLFLFQDWVTGLDWPRDSDNGDAAIPIGYDLYCFRVALAMASVPDEDFAGAVKAVRDVKYYAERLCNLSARTGCYMGIEVATKALRFLDKGWSERIPEYHKHKRNRMPEWARRDGFPQAMPVVYRNSNLDVASQLWEGLARLTFGLDLATDRDWDPHYTISSTYTSVQITEG